MRGMIELRAVPTAAGGEPLTALKVALTDSETEIAMTCSPKGTAMTCTASERPAGPNSLQITAEGFQPVSEPALEGSVVNGCGCLLGTLKPSTVELLPL